MAEQPEKKESGGKISFGFTKKKDTKCLEKNAHDSSLLVGKEETDFVHSLEGKEVKSTKPKEKENPLVIPLIKRNEYGRHGNRQSDAERKKAKEGSETVTSASDSLDDDAVKEIIKDAAQHNEVWEGRGNDDLNLTIPILMQNKVPDGTETDDNLDVSIRPDGASAADYSQVPIEQFGMAMLRGMGWKQQEGIGAKMKKVVKPIEAILRPKGQGLGADRRPGDELDKKRHRKLKPGDKKVEEEPQGFVKGVGVLVMGGAHKNLYGKIEGVDDDNARLVIKLALSGQAVTLSQFNVTMVDKEEYKKYSKDLSRFSKVHEEKRQVDNEHRSSKDSVPHRDKHSEKRTHSDDNDSSKHRTSDHDRNSDNQSDRYRDASRSSNRDRESDRHGHRSQAEYGDSHGEKHRDREERREETNLKKTKLEDTYGRYSPNQQTHNGDAESRDQTYWLRPDLRVRVIDRQYKKGRFYNSKVSIVDVVTRNTCTCKTEDNRLLEGIDQSMLETLIPKAEMACVMIVAGKLSGQLGSLVKRDKSRAKADVQLLRDRDQIKRLDYDDICEYAGNIHDEEDY